jgi:glycosyltransferase involved in cell wall biosynthesis
MNKVEVSVVVPTKNEKVTIAQFIDWCNQGFTDAGVVGEIILVDNSTDETTEIANKMGARVISLQENGLGLAYRAAQGEFKGKFVILGDADCTYDFRNIKPFISELERGFDFVIGNRFKGRIQKKAMPWHHQYFGSPATSFIFKQGLGLPTGDIHCGMRAMTQELFNALPFLEPGWEYATEMIISARNLDAKITEIPIEFFKEPVGRVSHHKRSSWLSPFKAGWGTLRVTTTYLIDRVFVIPGAFLLAITAILNTMIFISPQKFLTYFKIGLLAQSILVFISSIGAFAFTTGILARFAYRRKLTSLNRLAKSKFAQHVFSTLVIATLVELGLLLKVLYAWLSSFGEAAENFESSYTLISGWFSFTSIFFCILCLAIASLIGNHAQKFRR